MSKAVMQQAFGVLVEINKLSIGEHAICLPGEIDTAMDALRAVLAEPEQEPVAWMCPDDPDRRTAFSWPGTDRHSDFTVPLYTTPTPQREHITDGSPCWCNPDVFEEDGGNVIVHNYEDNWQQYAKPGETAQQCIERHRSEQDALMKLYATPRKPLTDKELDDLRQADGGALNFVTLRAFRVVARAVESAHGIGEQT